MSSTACKPAPKASFLTIPPEIRLKIYDYLLVLSDPPLPHEQTVSYRCAFPLSPPPTPIHSSSSSDDECSSSKKIKSSHSPSRWTNPRQIHISILRVCRLINHEATPLLYTKNLFTPHPVHLTMAPSLYEGPDWFHLARVYHSTSSVPRPIPQKWLRHIRRWYLRLQLDAPPQWKPDQVSRALSGAEEITVELFRAGYWCSGRTRLFDQSNNDNDALSITSNNGNNADSNSAGLIHKWFPNLEGGYPDGLEIAFEINMEDEEDPDWIAKDYSIRVLWQLSEIRGVKNVRFVGLINDPRKIVSKKFLDFLKGKMMSSHMTDECGRDAMHW
ncbi:uncharacterized protein CTHT_0053000 [Thermochaetoides thermophila DSM 1495]|uniref:DUF7730 domain-containing protein n=1 Tax=Chaetomium thermophilum (strain DSM 1495 / CBS 144.50 / IMI 039719) TaxID=759272 RepID=G0SDU2_CHATD|nr:hypothetical protein CTHT_0053000 [Thermochaetoides thermophila DSM 1495]EGS18693.1 hypothetical protein CTHT_0053000 [Thermochaetoides thermophila DSM 1495]